jgi:NitT/TauT family transport system permease protein
MTATEHQPLTTSAPASGVIAVEPARVPRGPSWRATWMPPLLALVAIIGVWYAIAAGFAAQGRGFLWPYPHDVLYSAFAEPAATAQIYPALLNTVLVAITGLVIAVVLGVAIAVLMAQARWVERSFFPYAVILQCVPILAITPLIGSIVGYNFAGKVVVTVIISLFPLIANTLFGLQATDKGQRELFQLQKASRWTRLMKLQAPAALPSFVVGLRNAAGLSVIGAVIGDQLMGQGSPGLGTAIAVFSSRIQAPETWAALLIASLFGVAVFLVFGLIGRLAVGRWFDLG